MAILEIPTFTDPSNYTEEVELDEAVFVLSFNFNSRDDRWYLDVLDQNDNQLRSSIRLVSGFPLFARWQIRGRPDGELTMIDPSGQDIEAGIDNIGIEVFLTYIEGVTVLSL